MTNLNQTRLLIADDHKMIGEACRRLLEPAFQVVGVVTDGRALIQAVRELRPAVVVLDLYMPQLNGLDAGEKIKHDNRLTKLVYLTMEPAPEIAMEAFRRGASGYVLKNCPDEELIAAVR
jgi:DNA-binding NarL/FixJ family response regulator